IHRNITGVEASELLMTEGRDGSFLIRPSSSSADHLTLSVRRNDEVIHIKIQQTDDFIDLYGGEQFASLPQLIDYYVNGLGRGNLRESNGKVIHLENPLPAQKYRGERWFHANLTCTESEVMLKNLKKEGSFLIRESSKKSGQFVLCYLNKDHDVIHNQNNLSLLHSRLQKGLYSIGDGLNCFPSLTELVDYYRTHDLVVMFKKNNNYSFRLQKSCVAGATAIQNLESKIAELEKEFDDRDKKRNGFWEEFETMEHNEASNKPMTAGYAPENKVKNRYRNILPYDDTRVKLLNVNPSEPGSDYINANYINARQTLPHIHKSYIACQGCVKVTIHDFWNMVWQENVNIIVMTTELIENGKNKCFLYWSETAEPLMVDLYKGPLSVTTESSTDYKDYTLRVFTLFHNNVCFQKRTVYQYHHRKWPDKCTPKDATGVVEFVLEINRQAGKISQNNQSSPWLIHCSAGIGRTGTFILIDLIINQIHREGLGCIIDIPKLLMDIRNQRAGLVQTEKQYTFVYKAVLLYVTKYNVR
ncbi:hypothetical protein HELRODRAFT_87671, partial [Helobdella robusta]|uniref:protein-tyrosine-phosphatase n=1 Tax=Helobdella robusta TaxID=6412 RepID=T1G6U0_HELRO